MDGVADGRPGVTRLPFQVVAPTGRGRPDVVDPGVAGPVTKVAALLLRHAEVDTPVPVAPVPVRPGVGLPVEDDHIFPVAEAAASRPDSVDTPFLSIVFYCCGV